MSSSEEPTGLVLESVERHACERCGVEMDVLGAEPFNSFNCPDCGAPFVVPARLGTFLLLSQIGRGGMGGVVFLARDELLARNVAIKIMPASVGVNREVIATFRREAQAAARLNHPNIAQVYSFGEENGQPYIVMELLSGSSLDKMIEAEGQLDEGFVINVGMQVAQGLRAADEASLTHGDIKPENILFDDKGNAKLVDFGIASFVNQASEGIWGTPYYIAPERLLRHKPDARSDMYCLGGTLYHALTGHPPFDGRTPAEVVKARLEIDPVPISQLRSGVHDEVETLVSRMLKRDPALRHPTYASLIGDLTRALRLVPQGHRTAAFSSVKAGKKIVMASATGRMNRATGAFGKTSGSIKVFAKPRDSQRIGGRIRESQQIDSAEEHAGTVEGEAKRGAGGGAVRRIVKALVVLLILGGLAAGGVWLYLSIKESRDKQFSDRKGRITLKSEQDRVPALWASIQQSASNVNRHAANACNYTGTVIRAVQSVLGETIDLPPPPAPAEAPAATSAATNATPAQGTNITAGATNQPPPQPAPVAVPPADAASEPLIKTEARKALSAVRDVLNARDTVERLREEAEKNRDTAMAATAAEMASVHVKSLGEKAEECRQAEADARRRSEEAKALAGKVETIRAKFERDMEKAKREQAERDRLEREARETQAAVERKKVLIDTETAAAGVARSRVQAHMQTYTFDKAVEELKAERSRFETDEGKAALEKSIERYQRMAALHRYVVEKLNAQPFGWGWIQGTSQEDVAGADEKGVRTKTGVWPWSVVTIRQYLHFFRRYADDRSLRAREAADNYLAAAIYCMENVLGSDNAKMVENATSIAREFTDRAKSATPTVGPDITRLLGFD